MNAMYQATILNTEPMFKSVGHALSVAFAMETTKPSVESTTEAVIKDLRERRYGIDPIEHAETSVNASGLRPNEFRAQCALIIGCVDATLPTHERDAIYARFGHQMRRAFGVRNLRDHYCSLCNTQSVGAVHALIMGIYVRHVTQEPGESPQAFNKRRKRRELEWSLRSIEREYGVGKNVLNRDQKMLRGIFYGLEVQAQEKLEVVFLHDGLIVDPNT